MTVFITVTLQYFYTKTCKVCFLQFTDLSKHFYITLSSLGNAAEEYQGFYCELRILEASTFK